MIFIKIKENIAFNFELRSRFEILHARVKLFEKCRFPVHGVFWKLNE